MRRATCAIVASVAAGLLVLSISGCAPQESIYTHRSVPITRPDPGGSPAGLAAASSAPIDIQSRRLAVAIAETEQSVWFFRLLGPERMVARWEEPWKEFLQTIHFGEDETPRWQLPEQWHEHAGSGLRFATIVIQDSDGPLEIAVSRFNSPQNLLENVNLWRGQLNLAPLEEQQLDEHLQRIEGQVDILVFDGTSAPGPMAGPPVAHGTPTTGIPGGSAGLGTAAASGGVPKFDPPDEWTPGRTSSITPARFLYTTDQGSIELTLTQLPADINFWEPNVQRWAEQLGIASLSLVEIQTATTEIEIDGIAGQRIRLDGPQAPAPAMSTLGAMIKRGDTAWFVKLTGPTQAMEQSEQVFDTFIQSLEF